jgi:microcompartment protein CcmL/EutN
MVEFSSIAIGIRASDAMVKAAPIDLFESRPISPGKYMSLITGEVAAVEASIQAGVRDSGPQAVVESFVLANLHDQVLSILNEPGAKGPLNAIGVIETSSAASVVEAADAICKTSPVQLIRLHLANHIGGKGFTVFTGEVADVEASLDAGKTTASSHLLEAVSIPNPYDDLNKHLLRDLEW